MSTIVKLAATGLTFSGVLLGAWLLKGSLEELFIGRSKFITPETGAVVGIVILVLSILRLRKKGLL